MEQLAGQPTIIRARALADAAFREVHRCATPVATAPGATTTPAATTASAATAPTALPMGAWGKVSLGGLPNYPPPRIVRLASPHATLQSEDALSREALEHFRAHPKETEFGRIGTMEGDSKSRVYRYAAAVRLDRSCLACHAEYLAWLRPEPGPATLPTSLPAGGVPHLTTAPATAPAAWPVVALVRVDVPWQIDENQLLLNRIVIVVAGMLGGTLAIVVFYLITTRLILQPVRVLRNTAEKVAKGDLNIRSAISTGDEFQQLSETFNTMLATLKELARPARGDEPVARHAGRRTGAIQRGPLRSQPAQVRVSHERLA